MICPGCQSNLGHINKSNEPMVRGRGLVLKADGVSMVCPKCKGDVPLSTEVAKALQHRLVLFFQNPPQKV